MEKIASKINLQSNVTFIVVWFCITVVFCIAAIFSSHFLFSLTAPEALAGYFNEIIRYTYMTTFILSGTLTFCFMLVLKHVQILGNEMGYKVRHDALTGILSREAFLEDFDEEQASKVEPRMDALLVIDADNFKKINDTHGHQVGDKALIAITKALSKGIRSSDKIGRLGGEEFAIHLKHVDRYIAGEVAERLRRNVKAESNSLGIEGLSLSVSIGLVGYADNLSPDKLMKKADDLLYKAKQLGRDRVEKSFDEYNTAIETFAVPV